MKKKAMFEIGASIADQALQSHEKCQKDLVKNTLGKK